MEENEFQCINCGCPAEKLYHDYKAGITKVTHCTKCGNIVDKYVEYDSSIILLDVLLLHKPAYAHLLINVHVKSHWRLAVLLWVIEAFVKLIQQRSDYVNVSNNTLSESEGGLGHSFIGLELYLHYLMAVVELSSFLLCVLGVLAVRSLILTQSLKWLNTFNITKAILLSNLGSILAMPALLWGKSLSPVFVWLGQVFVCLSALQALRVVMVGSHKTLFALMAVGIGIMTQTLLCNAFNNWINNFLAVSL